MIIYILYFILIIFFSTTVLYFFKYKKLKKSIKEYEEFGLTFLEKVVLMVS